MIIIIFLMDDINDLTYAIQYCGVQRSAAAFVSHICIDTCVCEQQPNNSLKEENKINKKNTFTQ